MEEVMPADPSIEELRQRFTEKTLAENDALGVSAGSETSAVDVNDDILVVGLMFTYP